MGRTEGQFKISKTSKGIIMQYRPGETCRTYEYDRGDKTLFEVKDKMIGIGGAPIRATTLPTDGAERKNYPVGTGVLDYFPDALVAIAAVSQAGNDQHNPGKPLHWDRSKSTDEADTLIRHFLQRGTVDVDGHKHSTKMAWRALALLQKEIEEDQKKGQSSTNQ